MVNYSQALDVTFSALADPTRRAILARLASSETTVGELAQPFAMSLPAVSKHLSVLEKAGLLEREKNGRIRRCRLVPAPMKTAAEWIDRYRQFWEERFDALEDYLSRAKQEEEQTWPPNSHPRKPQRASGSRAPSRRGARRSSRPGPTRKR